MLRGSTANVRRQAMDSATVAPADAQDMVTPDWSLYGPVRNFE